MSDIAVGDYVTIGDNALTWEVLSIEEHGLAYLKSGQSGQRRFANLEDLRLHSKAANHE